MDPMRSNKATNLPRTQLPATAETKPCLAEQGDPDGPEQTVRLRAHSAEEWEAVYPIIRRLYVMEHKKLQELMAIMEHKHGFKAT
jgi:hypothetical protein